MENQESPFKAGLNLGLILGIISIVIVYLVYFFAPESMVSWQVSLAILVIYIGGIIYFGLQYRASIGGFMTFGYAFNYSFIAMATGLLLTVCGNLLLYYVIDPSLPGVLIERQFEIQMAMLEQFGAADAMTSEQMDEMRKANAEGFTVFGQLKGFGVILIFYAIVALILGAILKKRDKSLDY
jgi:hypothetical protein